MAERIINIPSGSLLEQLFVLPGEIIPANGEPQYDPREEMFLELYVRDTTTDNTVNQIMLSLLNELLISIFIYSDRMIINPGIHLRYMGFSAGVYKIKYNFFRNIVGDYNDENERLIINVISPSRTEVEVKLPADIDIHSKLALTFLGLAGAPGSFIQALDVYINLGDDRNILITNKKYIDDKLYLKLVEPIPDEINKYDKFFITQKLIDSYEDRLTLYTERLEDFSGLNYLKGPVVDYKAASLTYRTTPLENFDQLVTTNNVIQQDLVNMFVSASLIEGIDLNIDFRDFSNFIHFSSATERVAAFKYKVQQIEFFDSKIAEYTPIASAALASARSTIYESSSISYYKDLKNDVITSFDSYDNYLYYQSHSYESGSEGEFYPSTWPKYTSTKPYSLYSYTASQATNWYTSQYGSASIYDNMNPDKLSNFVPLEMQLDNENKDYVKFVNMIGHYLDINYNYINRMTSINERENPINKGIPQDLILPVVNHFGFDLRSGNVIKKLYEKIYLYAPSGSSTFSSQSALDLFTYTGSFERGDTDVINTNYSIDYSNQYNAYRDITREIWKRILNNLPHLYKTKGTVRGLQSLITCYGIPSQFLYVREYGGPDVSESVFNEYKFDNFSHAVLFQTNQAIEFDWTTSSLYNRYPSVVQFRFNTTGSYDTLLNSMSLVEVQDSWSLSVLHTSNEMGKIKFSLLSSGAYAEVTTSALPIFDNRFTMINLQRESASDGEISQSFNLAAKKYMLGSMLYSVSASLTTSASANLAWRHSGSLQIGGLTSSFALPFSGAIDEFRLWETPLTEPVINSHVKFPQSLIGNTLTGSYNDLLLRLPFDNPINFTLNYMTSSFSNEAYSQAYPLNNLVFTGWNASETTFPFNFRMYEYESEAHSINLGAQRQSSNKIRIESSSLSGDLSTMDHVEVSQYDLAQLDSNKLGIFFSPADLINEDIIKALAVTELGDFIGDPSDLYSESYQNLDTLRNLYWHLSSRRASLPDYLNYIRYYDISLFDHIRWMIPARAKAILGVLYEPTVLERPKAKYTKPTLSSHFHDKTIRMPMTGITASYLDYSYSHSMFEYFATGSEIFTDYNIYTIITASDYYDGVSGSYYPMVLPVVDFDHHVIYYGVDVIRTPLTQSYSFTDGYQPRHYKNYEGFYTWEKRLKYDGCAQNAKTTTDQLPAWQIWSVNPNTLEAKDDGVSYVQVK